MNQDYINSTIKRISNCLKKIKYTVDIQSSLLKIIDNSSNFEQLQNHLKEIALTPQQKADVFFKAFLVKQQPEYIFKAGALSPSYHFLGWVTKTLIDTKFDSFDRRDKMEKIEKWNQENIESFFNNLDLTRDDIEHFWDLIPQGKIDQFFKKEKNIQTKIKNVGWYNDNIEVSLTKATEIGNFEGGKLYGYLPPEFDDKQYHNALIKGFAARAKGNNGIKFLEKKLLELKINGDDRLCTSKVYENDHGDYLAIFEHEANHKGIKQVMKKAEIKFESCFYQSPDDFYASPEVLDGDIRVIEGECSSSGDWHS